MLKLFLSDARVEGDRTSFSAAMRSKSVSLGTTRPRSDTNSSSSDRSSCGQLRGSTYVVRLVVRSLPVLVILLGGAEALLPQLLRFILNFFDAHHDRIAPLVVRSRRGDCGRLLIT